MKNKISLAFLASYLISYLLFVDRYINSNTYLSRVLNQIIHQTELNQVSLIIILIASTIFISLSSYIIYYFAMVFVIRKMTKKNHDFEKLSISILLSETFSNVVALLTISIFPNVTSFLIFILPIIGMSIFYILLKNEYENKVIVLALIVRGIFYLLNYLTFFSPPF